MQFEAAGAPTKTETKTTFGSDIDGTTITFTGDEAPVGKSASVTPAEALNTSNGTLTYKSDRTDIVAVDETTGRSHGAQLMVQQRLQPHTQLPKKLSSRIARLSTM